MSTIQDSKIIQAWLVLTLALFFGAMLAGVQLALGPKIEENKKNETLEKIPVLVLGQELADKMAAENQFLDIKPKTIGVSKHGRKIFYNVYAVFYDGTQKGWAIKSKGQGYADRIELLVGLTPTMNKITGLFILGQKETPGLGNKIVTDEWRGQFNGIPAIAPLNVVKGKAGGGSDIQAITGATISSRSVTQIINTAIADLRIPLTKTGVEEN